MDKLSHFLAVVIGFIVFTATGNLIVGALAGVAAEAIILPVVLVRGQKRSAGAPASPEETVAQAAAKKRRLSNTFYFILCVLYIVCSVIMIALATDESAGLMVAGEIVVILGCAFLLARKHFGILVSLAGSVFVIAASFVTDIYHPYESGRFDTAGLIGVLLLTIVPGILLLTMILVSTKGRLFKSKQG